MSVFKVPGLEATGGAVEPSSVNQGEAVRIDSSGQAVTGEPSYTAELTIPGLQATGVW